MNFTRPRSGHLILTTAAIVATIVASSIVHPSQPARAADAPSDESVSAQDVSQALDTVPEGLVRDAVTAPTAASPLTIAIPSDASDGVSLAAGDFEMTIGLPNASEATSAARASNGAVAYPSDGDSANAVVPVRGGVQLLSVIENRDADDSYSYPVTIPAGNVLTTTPDGGAQIVDEEGVVKVGFEPAWAKDATGRSIPTRYTVRGNVLTQIVDHREASEVTYPVVADPLPVILIVVTAAAAIIVAAAALGIATWIVINWWNYCRTRGKYPQLSTRGGFTARCVN